jgi:hypothetical protein
VNRPAKQLPAGVIVPALLTDADKAGIFSVIRQVSDSPTMEIHNGSPDFDFWISNGRLLGVDCCDRGRPFILVLGDSLSAGKINSVTSACAWAPKDQIGFAAMCNSDIDHILLAHLCLYFSEKFSGVVDFGGDLRHYTSDEGILTDVGVCATTYTSDAGESCVSYLLFPNGLRRWCQHPDFRMVK